MVKYPVIFVHGLIASGKFYEEYTCVDEYGRGLGVNFLLSRRSRYSDLANRVEQLQKWIKANIPGDEYHLIGHSAGGLDAAFMLSADNEITRRCLSLTAIGSPFLGSPVADYVLRSDEVELLILHKLINHLDIEKMIQEMGTQERQSQIPVLNSWTQYYSMPFYMRPQKIGGGILSASTKKNYERMVQMGHAYNDGVVPTEHQILPGSRILRPAPDRYFEGEHKAQTVPFRYGYFPWSTIWKQTFLDVFKNLANIEAQRGR
jgi:pimeloyl-ACP methyl ester carboxylesterase